MDLQLTDQLVHKLQVHKTVSIGVVLKSDNILRCMDNGHPERAFFQKFKSFGLGQTNWGAFWLFPAKLLALFWHCESLVHGKV